MVQGVNSFRTSLQDEELSGVPIFGPFDIHRSRSSGPLGIMLLDGASPAGEFQDFVVAQTTALALGLHHFTGTCATSIESVYHLHFFSAYTPAHNGPRSLFQCWFEDDPFIGSGHALDDCFAQSPRAVDDDNVTKARCGIKREHHAGACLI